MITMQSTAVSFLAPSLLILGLSLGAAERTPAQEVAAPIVIYGGTSSGVMAAVQARRMGRRVLLIEPSRHVGGMTVCGLGATDIGNKAAVGGLAREFYRALRRWYSHESSWVWQRADEFRGRGHRAGDDAAWTFEPHVAERLMERFLEDAGVELLRGRPLDRDPATVRKEGTRLRSVRLKDGTRVRGSIFIDASYEGDLLALAGASFHVGREANATYGETLNGLQRRRARFHQFTHAPDPYRVPGKPESGLLFGIGPRPEGAEGSGDARIQAYCFRICATDAPENRIPWPKPEGYDPQLYELLLRNFEAGDHRIPWHPVRMPNRKTDSNNNFSVSTDVIGANHRYATADDAERRRILSRHLRYTQGLLWTLANHPRVPRPVRDHFQRFGLCADEFVANDHWPYTVYVREARRLVGTLVMTEHHCRGTRTVSDAVGLGAYGMDSHHVQRYVDAEGRVRNEGDIQVHGFPPYPVSYRALLPRRDEVANLLVPVALSASHIAYGSIRMEPVFMILGQSAATAAALALEQKVELHDLPYELLRARLVADGQILEWSPPPARPAPRGIALTTLAGSVVDDASAEVEGSWVSSHSQKPYVERGYRHDGNEAKGTKRLRFRLRAPRAGRYELRFAWQPHANRAPRVPLVVRFDGHERRFFVDQRKRPPLNGLWISLLTCRFAAPTTVELEVSNAGTEGYVVADAAALVPVPAEGER